jgi:hypothetical protein
MNLFETFEFNGTVRRARPSAGGTTRHCGRGPPVCPGLPYSRGSGPLSFLLLPPHRRRCRTPPPLLPAASFKKGTDRCRHAPFFFLLHPPFEAHHEHPLPLGLWFASVAVPPLLLTASSCRCHHQFSPLWYASPPRSFKF